MHAARPFLFLQIFEWCQFMMLSGQLTQELFATADPVCIRVTTGCLSQEHMVLLDHAYADMMPEYSELLREYSNACKRAKVARWKSTFPDRAHWHPHGRQLTYGEKSLLTGPENVSYMKKVAVSDPNTRRMIEYGIVSDREQKWISCAYICVESNDASPMFGHITHLFHYSFAGQTHTWTIIEKCTHPVQDTESKLWYALPENTITCIVSLNLSHP